MKNVCVHVRTCTCRPGVNFGYYSSGTIHLILWARDWPWFTEYWSMLAGQQTQAICLFPPPQGLGYKHEPPCSSISRACAISIHEEDPQQELSQGLKQCWGSQSLNWRKKDFILLNKKGGLRGKEGDKEEEGRGRKGKGMFECVWRNMQNRQRNYIFPRQFLINTNKAWVIFPIKMNAFSKPVHW